jgi:hypothetical protein
MRFEWQTRVVSSPASFAIDIFIFREVAGARVEYISSLGGVAGVEVTMVDKGTRMEPAIKLEGGSGQEILQAISDGLFAFGIKPTQEPVLKNELTATKYHLSDMRDMVCIVSGIKKGEDLGKDSKYVEDGGGITRRPSS